MMTKRPMRPRLPEGGLTGRPNVGIVLTRDAGCQVAVVDVDSDVGHFSKRRGMLCAANGVDVDDKNYWRAAGNGRDDSVTCCALVVMGRKEAIGENDGCDETRTAYKLAGKSDSQPDRTVKRRDTDETALCPVASSLVDILRPLTLTP